MKKGGLKRNWSGILKDKAMEKGDYAARFPSDFRFQLTHKEYELWASQGSGKGGHGGRRTLPYGYSQAGVAMLSTVLKTERAMEEIAVGWAKSLSNIA